MTTSLRVLFFTMANLNTIDGSSIWMHSVAETLHTDPRLEIAIPLRARERRDVITRGLRRLERVTLIPPKKLRALDAPALTLAESLAALEEIDAHRPSDIVLLRAYDVCLEAARSGKFAGRLWSCYILEPERDTSSPDYIAGMTAIAQASRHVICQSEEMRALLESLVPAAIGKTILLAPAVPVETVARPDPGRIVRRMIYTGKFHPFYPVDRMIDAFRQLRSDLPDLEFHVAGDKFHRPKGDSTFASALERALLDTPGVHWHGGIGRDEVEALLAEGGVALSLWDFRHGPLMNNLVISTKLLDSCVVGLPIILNRTVAQEEVLGHDYPLFVSAVDEAWPLLRRLFSDPELYREAAVRCFEASRRFTYPAVYEGIGPYVDRVADEATVPSTGKRRIAVVATGVSEVETLLTPLVRFDVHRTNSPDARPGTVVFEAGDDGLQAPVSEPRAGQRRVLRVPVRAALPGDLAGFDCVVVQDPATAASLESRPAGSVRAIVIPTALDEAQLARPKLPGAMFTIAVAGVPDDAQAATLGVLLEALRALDERFRIVVRVPLDRFVRTEEALAGAATASGTVLACEPADCDTANWYRTIGFVVATDPGAAQSREALEASASGAVPVILGDPGTAAWLVPGQGRLDPARAAARIVEVVRSGESERAGRAAAALVRDSAGLAAARAAWDRALS